MSRTQVTIRKNSYRNPAPEPINKETLATGLICCLAMASLFCGVVVWLYW